jgi:type I restriction enzyme R subunit
MIATSFYSPDGKPMSSAEFIKRLFGELPELFKNEDELRELWSHPDTRRKLLDRLEEKGYGKEELAELKRIVEAEKSDLYDVLAYIAFAKAPIDRAKRVDSRKDSIFSHYDNHEQQFLSFVLDHYVDQGVGELNPEKLPQLIDLKYHTVGDAVGELGSIANIRKVFVGFQAHLYAPPPNE